MRIKNALHVYPHAAALFLEYIIIEAYICISHPHVSFSIHVLVRVRIYVTLFVNYTVLKKKKRSASVFFLPQRMYNNYDNSGDKLVGLYIKN